MADPAIGELHTQLANRCARLEKARLAGLSQSQNEVGLEDTDIQAQEGDYASSSVAASAAHRRTWSNLVSDQNAKNMLDPIIRNYGVLINSPAESAEEIFEDLHDYFAETGVAAQGTLTMDTNPTDGDTMTIDSVTYRFKSTMAAAEDIKLEGTLAATQAHVEKTINGDGIPGTNFYVGSTSPHTTVKCAQTWTGSDELVLTARSVGTAGDAITTTETFTAGSNVFDDTTLGGTTAGVNQLTVQSRVFSYDTVAAASNSAGIGNGTILRLTEDWQENALEGGWADTVRVECVQGTQEGATKHQEAFTITGKAPGRDRLAERGSGASTGMTALSARDSEALLISPSFTQMTPTTNNQTVTALTGWTTTSGGFTNVVTSIGTAGTEYYRDVAGESSPKALEFTGDDGIYQVLKNAIDYTRPYALRLAYLPVSAAAGSVLYMSLRDYSDTSNPGAILAQASVAITGSTWQTLVLGPDFQCWPRVWAAGNDIALEIRVGGLSSGSVVIDDIVFAPFTEHDGLWYAAVGGTTRFARRDAFDFTDSETGAIVGRWLHRAYGRSLPVASSSPSVTEPTVT